WPYVKSSRFRKSCQYRYESSWYTKTARCSPPCPPRSPCPSPSRLSRRAMTGPPTGAFHTAVYTDRPRQRTSFGMPALTDLSVPTTASASRPDRIGSSRRQKARDHDGPGPRKPSSAEQGTDGADVRGVHVLHERRVRADRGLDPVGRSGVGGGLLEVHGALAHLLVGVDRLAAEDLGGLGGALAVLADLLAGGEVHVGHGGGFLPSMSLLATLA